VRFQRNAQLWTALLAAWLLTGCDALFDGAGTWEEHRALVLADGSLPRAGRLDVALGSLGLVTESVFEYRLDEDGSLEGFRVIPLTGLDQGLVVHNSDGAWEKSTGGAVRRLSPREAEQAVLDALFLSGAYLELEPFTGPEGEVELMHGGARYRLTLGPGGSLAGAEVFFDERVYHVGFHDSGRDAPRLPRSFTVGPEGSPPYRLTAGSFEELDPDEVDLTPPAPSGLSYDRDAERSVPLRLSGGMLLVPVTVDGLEVEFALDSGAAIGYVRPHVARRLGLEPLGESVVVSLGNDASDHGVALVDEMRIGPATLAGQTVVIGEPSLLLSLATSFDGLIGYDLLARLPVRLDVEAGRLEVLPPEVEPEVPPGAVVIPVSLPGRLPQVRGELEGARGLDFILDSGSPLELLVLPRSSGRLMNLSGAPPEEYTFMSLAGLGGVMAAFLREAAYFQVGAPAAGGGPPTVWRVAAPRVTYALADAEGPLSYMDADALLGLPFLLRFSAVTFDYPRERLILKPRKEAER
jgi:hypothetical protein